MTGVEIITTDISKYKSCKLSHWKTSNDTIDIGHWAARLIIIQTKTQHNHISV